MCKELKQQNYFSEIYEKCSKNKRIALQTKFIIMTEIMSQITKITKSIKATKNVQKQPRKRPIQTDLVNEEKKMLTNNFSGSASDCIIVASRR